MIKDRISIRDENDKNLHYATPTYKTWNVSEKVEGVFLPFIAQGEAQHAMHLVKYAFNIDI